jgi:hypothetical protein
MLGSDGGWALLAPIPTVSQRALAKRALLRDMFNRLRCPAGYGLHVFLLEETNIAESRLQIEPV